MTIQFVQGDATAPAGDGTKMIVHVCNVGCGLAGGDWSMIEPIIAKTLTRSGVAASVYDFAED